MSQHYFTSMHEGAPVVITMGWDRPLQGFFLTVEREDVDESEDESCVYSNLDDPGLLADRGLPKSLTYFLAKLSALNLAVPQRMIDEVQADQRANVGNRYVHYDAAGVIFARG